MVTPSSTRDSEEPPIVRAILLVEDNPDHAAIIRRACERMKEPYDLCHVETLAEARRSVERGRFDLAVVDYLLSDGSGMELLKDDDGGVLERIPKIVLTSHGSEELAVEALRLGAVDYVVKGPESLANMPQRIERLLAEKRLQRELKESKDRFAALFAVVPAMVVVTAKTTGVVVEANRTAVNYYGWPAASADRDVRFPDDVMVDTTAPTTTLFEEDRDVSLDVHRRGDGVSRAVEVAQREVLIAEELHVISHITDIQDQIDAEHALTRSLYQRDVLLQEVHHRVKNNIQLILSLVSLWERVSGVSLHGPGDAFRRRLLVIAEAHQFLSDSESIGSVSLESYLRNVLSHRDDFDPAVLVRVLAGADPRLNVPLDQLVPLSLLVSEIVAVRSRVPVSRQCVVQLEVQNGRTSVRITDPVEDEAVRSVETSFSEDIIQALAEQCGCSASNSPLTTADITLTLPESFVVVPE